MFEMSENPTLLLESVSIVVTAQFHNPSILNPDFLVVKGIVPDDWQVNDTVTTPVMSSARYDNGINWTIDQSRLLVAEPAGPQFRDSYRIQQFVKAYLSTLPHIPYQGLGLNFHIVLPEPDPRRRLIERFGANWIGEEDLILEMTPSFRLQTEDALCLVTISCTPQNDGKIKLDCNVHHEHLSNSVEFCDAITKWPVRQRFVQSVLSKLFKP